MFGQKSSDFEELLRRPEPSLWEQFWRAPFIFIAQWLYACRTVIPARPIANPVSVVCVSDTHNNQPTLPEGDVLIHAGDLTNSGTFKEIQTTLDWLRAQPFQHKVVIAGNHDTLLDSSRDRDTISQEQRASLNWGDVIYLENSSATLTCENGRRLQVHGSPQTPKNGSGAFQYPRHTSIWSGRIPAYLDILITHGPPRGHLDARQLGCTHLLRELWRSRPAMHVFGHIHQGYGQEWLLFDDLQEAYERIVTKEGSVRDLWYLFYAFLRSKFLSSREAQCQLVNAAVVGGFRDEKRRAPIRVVI